MISLRVARKEDSESILAIYSPYVENTNISFEYEVPVTEEFTARVEGGLKLFPWLVAESNGEIIGFAYGSKHRDRAAYQWSAECSVYIREDYHGKGLARLLYEALLDVMKEQKIINLYAGIAQPNEASTMFHVKMGFTPVGVYKKVGYKQGQWHDVLWLHRTVTKHPATPEAIIYFPDAAIQEKTVQILADKTAHYAASHGNNDS